MDKKEMSNYEVGMMDELTSSADWLTEGFSVWLAGTANPSSACSPANDGARDGVGMGNVTNFEESVAWFEGISVTRTASPVEVDSGFEETYYKYSYYINNRIIFLGINVTLIIYQIAKYQQ